MTAEPPSGAAPLSWTLIVPELLGAGVAVSAVSEVTVGDSASAAREGRRGKTETGSEQD